MIYLTKDELGRLFAVAHKHNPVHHCLFVTAFFNGLRVSELLSITGRDVVDGQLSIQRAKKSKKTVQPIHVDSDPVFDGSLLLTLARETQGRVLDFSRQYIETQHGPNASRKAFFKAKREGKI